MALRKPGWSNGHSTIVILMIFCNLAVSKQKLRPSERKDHRMSNLHKVPNVVCKFMATILNIDN